jgi:uncharacterized repeat protein (TIGR01451 family)
LYNTGGWSKVQNSIVWGNRTPSGRWEQIKDHGTSLIAHSDIEGCGGSGADWDASLGTDLGGNLDANPLFVEPVEAADAPVTGGDLRLRFGSPAIDAGDNSLVPTEVTTDLAGNPRITHGIVDMGAYELPAIRHSSKTASRAAAPPGVPLTYTLAIVNPGLAEIEGIRITDTLPALLTYAADSLSATGGSYGYEQGTITWTGSVSGGGAVTIDFGTQISQAASLGVTIANSAVIRGGEEVFTRTAVIRCVEQLYLPLAARE